MSVRETHYVVFGHKTHGVIDDEDENGEEIAKLVALRPDYKRQKNQGTIRLIQDHMSGGDGVLGYVHAVADAYQGEGLGFTALPSEAAMHLQHDDALSKAMADAGLEVVDPPRWYVLTHYT